MKRVLGMLALLIAACDDPTAPTAAATPAPVDCWAYQAFPFDGYVLTYWAHFTPCPSERELRETGWTRGAGPT